MGAAASSLAKAGDVAEAGADAAAFGKATGAGDDIADSGTLGMKFKDFFFGTMPGSNADDIVSLAGDAGDAASLAGDVGNAASLAGDVADVTSLAGDVGDAAPPKSLLYSVMTKRLAGVFTGGVTGGVIYQFFLPSQEETRDKVNSEGDRLFRNLFGIDPRVLFLFLIISICCSVYLVFFKE